MLGHRKYGRNRGSEKLEVPFHRWLLVASLVVAAAGACSDDDASDPRDAGGTAGSDDEGGEGGGRSGSGGAFGAGGPPEPPSCEPRPEPSRDACLACVADMCCAELFGCGGVGEQLVSDAGYIEYYTCYDSFFVCVRDCFEEVAATASSARRSEEIMLQCGADCAVGGPDEFDYRSKDLLACAAGTPRPPLPSEGEDAGVETDNGDDDGGIAELNCSSECFPSWR